MQVVFVNDNRAAGARTSRKLIQGVQRDAASGAPLIQTLRPEKADFVVLKSTLSGFYETPLHAMLQLGQVQSVVVTGLLSGNCVLFTAADAYMRNYRVVIPSDCVTDRSDEHQRDALAKMKDVLKARVMRSDRLRFRR